MIAAVMVATVASQPTQGSFRHEWRDFLRFIVRPRLAPRLAGRQPGHGEWQDWFSGISLRRLLQWAGVLWAFNLLFLGPIALAAAGAGGAEHRLNLHNIPWLHALIWAPVIEELTFRYGLRKPGRALWLVPTCVVALLAGPQWHAIALVGAVVLLCWWPYLRPASHKPAALPWRWRRAYLAVFPLVVHGSCLLFAAVHLNNFSLNQTPWWLMPLLVLPQWLTGLALAWLRVQRGIGASMLLHGVFNGGPLLVVWLILQWVPLSPS